MKNDEIDNILESVGRCCFLRAKTIRANNYRLKSIRHPYNATYIMDKSLDSYSCKIPGNIKYAMFVHDSSIIGDKELYVIIGQNPSYSFAHNVDGTNQNIYKTLLKLGIHRYLLLNTFPIIDSNGAKSENTLKTKINIAILKKLIKKFRKQISIKIVFACGNSLRVYSKSIKTLNRLIKKYKLESLAFEHNGIPQCHLSSQALRKNGATTQTITLSQYRVTVCDSSKFSAVCFHK